jgi:hypothetical protein
VGDVFSVDEVINRFMGWSHSRRGRWVLTAAGFVVAVVVVVVPLVTRSSGRVAPPPAVNAGVAIPLPTAPLVVPATTPDTLPMPGDRRIGGPLITETPTTVASPPKAAPTTSPAVTLPPPPTVSPATSPATTPVTTPPPPPQTTPPQTAPPATTAPPDTGVVVPYSP